MARTCEIYRNYAKLVQQHHLYQARKQKNMYADSRKESLRIARAAKAANAAAKAAATSQDRTKNLRQNIPLTKYPEYKIS